MYFLGIDIGSVASKVCIIDAEKNIIAQKVLGIGSGSSGPQRAFNDTLAAGCLKDSDIKYTVATGYGRLNYAADREISEISCQARAIHYLFQEVRTIIDIGGQDAKVIRINERGQVQNFVMNEKCAAGTGRFLEVMARALEYQLSDMESIALMATKKTPISSICTVFAESEVISHLAAGEKTSNIVAGINRAIAVRVASLSMRLDITREVVLTGGVAQNKGILNELQDILNVPIVAPENPQLTGALGAALYALEYYLKEKQR